MKTRINKSLKIKPKIHIVKPVSNFLRSDINYFNDNKISTQKIDNEVEETSFHIAIGPGIESIF